MMTYEEHEQDWKRKHRASLPRKKGVSSAREFFWIGFWLLVAAGAAIFSAAHTIPAAEMTIFKTVAQRGLLAITAFVIVELVIFGAAAGRREIKWLGLLLAGAVLVALAGNISSSLRAVSENGGDWLNQFGGVLLAIIAPITALAAGEVLHIQLDKRSAKLNAAQAEYDAALREMDAKINQAYTRHVRDFEKPSSASLSVQTDNRQTGSGYTRVSSAVEKAKQWLIENPDMKNLPVRDLADMIGVGKDSVAKAKQTLNGYSSNGHTVEESNQ